MRMILATLAWLTSLSFASAAEIDANFWIAKARSIIISHHLLSSSDLRCTGLIYGIESTSTTAGIEAIEKHGGGCKGDPATMPRMFSMEIDKATGQAKWDRDTGDFVMKPIP